MNKFILVHDAANSASPILLNSKNIVYAEESNSFTGATYIKLLNTDDYGIKHGYHVTETREQIFEMLK